jgi:hypothetical protein
MKRKLATFVTIFLALFLSTLLWRIQPYGQIPGCEDTAIGAKKSISLSDLSCAFHLSISGGESSMWISQDKIKFGRRVSPTDLNENLPYLALMRKHGILTDLNGACPKEDVLHTINKKLRELGIRDLGGTTNCVF